MLMNVPSNAVTSNNNNSKNKQGAGDAAAAEGQDEAQPSSSTSNGNNIMQASNYDATKVRKSKKRAETEIWQEKILRCLEPVEVPQAETPNKDYIDQALVTLGMQMRENLSNHEILDLIEDIQATVNGHAEKNVEESRWLTKCSTTARCTKVQDQVPRVP